MTLSGVRSHAHARLRSITPERAIGWLPWSAVVAAALALGVIAIHVAFQKRTDLSQRALASTLAVVLPALVLARAPSAPLSRPGRASAAGLTAWALALNLGIVLLIVPAFLAVWQTDWDAITGWRLYPFVNKRWLGALYALMLLTLLVFPAALEGWLTDRASKTEADTPMVRRAAWWLLVLQLAALLAAAWYLAGPPWNVGGHHRGIDLHEQVHLGPLQAISKGATPYIGAASTQYGPGFQMFVYAYMSVTQQFNLVGFREAFLALHLATFGVFAIIARAYAGFATAWLILLGGVLCSPLKFFTFMADGGMGESFGWGSAARYLGVLVVLPAIAVLTTRGVMRHRWWCAMLGIAWGVLAWGGQESFASVVTGGALLVVVLLATGTTTVRRVIATLARVAAGFAAVWVPILAWYASDGLTLAFIANYWRVPGAVAAGFSNTWWSDGPADPLARAFYYTPFVIVGLGVLTIWDWRSWQVRRPLNRDQVRLLSFTCALAASYPTVLYRSDSLHLLNTLIALPFVLVLALRDLPGWLSSTWPGRAGIRLVLAAVVLAIYPLTPQLTNLYDWVLFPPTYKYRAAAVAPAVASAGIAFDRATPGLRDEPSVNGEGTGPMRKFLEDAGELRRLVGTRPTFVHSAGPYYTGLVYFMADLTPAPYLYDIETMLLNDRLQTEAWAHFQKHINQVECVIVSSTDAFEARVFLSANPAARVLQRSVGAAAVYVILAGAPDQP